MRAREAPCAHPPPAHPPTHPPTPPLTHPPPTQEEIVPLCRELGIGIVAYSPLGRGFLTGAITNTKDLAEGDFRRSGMPRFEGDNFDKASERAMGCVWTWGRVVACSRRCDRPSTPLDTLTQPAPQPSPLCLPAQNFELVSKVKDMAARKGCTPGQLALAWVLAQVGGRVG